MAIAALIVSLVIAATSTTRADAQPPDCSGVFDASYEASVSTPAELDTAIDCYNTVATATGYSIYLLTDMDYGDDRGPAEIVQSGSGFSLSVEGNGHKITGLGTHFSGDFGVVRVGAGASPVSISDAVLTSTEEYIGSALVSGGFDTKLVDSRIFGLAGRAATGVQVFAGEVTITNTEIIDASFGVHVGSGATATIAASTMYFRLATGLSVDEGGSATVVNSTIAASEPSSGAVYANGDVSVTSSTILGPYPGLGVRSLGGGVVSVESSIVEVGCSGGVVGSNNFVDPYNLDFVEDDISCGTSALLSPGSLGSLADNGCAVPGAGGCGWTAALDPGSNAVDAGPACANGASFDQRGAGFVRLAGAECDAGAFEVQSAAEVLCDGLAVTINMNTNGGVGFGTPGDDVILGTPGPDTINGVGGNDTVCAGGGGDTVFAGAGDDRVFGEGGADTIYGATGDDYVSAGYGNDEVFGQGGFDVLLGNSGNDLIKGLGANDFIYGGRGDDRLFGNGGVDRIWGGPGLDLIWGNNAGDFLYGEGTRDIIRGGGGADVIEGGGGNDDLYGEAGADTLSGGAATDIFNGGPGPDTCTDAAGGETTASC